MSTADRVVLFAAVTLMLPGAATAQERWRPAEPDYEWSFPRDHWGHPDYRTEWWYVTGIVVDTSDPDRRFGYQFTFFRVGLVPRPLGYESAWATQSLIMGHASISDLSTGRHVFSEILFRPNKLLGDFGVPGDSLIAWSRAPYGTDGHWTLAWNGQAFDFAMRDDTQGVAFSLSTEPAKPMVFQGPNGYSRKGEGPTAASLYYSFTRLVTSGEVTIGGDTLQVAGESWMDKEFGSNQLAEDQVGWDWLSLRLDDGRELMLYVLRSDKGTDYARGTIISAAGDATYIDDSAWTLLPSRQWRSHRTGAEYPAAWKLTVPEIALDATITPVLDEQENVSALVPGLFYWEGAVDVRTSDGQRIGEGYVELTGYGTRRVPAI
jgi:predicted secreted hydrolase